MHRLPSRWAIPGEANASNSHNTSCSHHLRPELRHATRPSAVRAGAQLGP